MDSIIHSGVKCQQCQVYPITGIRYKCLNCDCYNLCEVCEEQYGKNHGHPLLKLRNTEQTEMFQKRYNIKEDKLKQPISLNPTFKCVNSSLYFKTINNNNFITIPIKLLNNGKTNWPLPCFFNCIKEKSDIKGDKVKINKCSGEPMKTVDFKVKLDLSKINKSGDYISVWSLEDEKGVAFGPKVTIKVNDIFEEKLKLKLKPYYLINKLDMKIMDFKPITTDELLAKKNKK